ncbi:MAG: flagellar protein FlgN [Syntrophomonadaceae bacterium]|nr:flagellar protein FlgN [Syntrophomonadaceae bacterium]
MEDVRALNAKVRQQVALYEKVLDLSRNQLEVVRKEDPEGEYLDTLLQLLEKRQALIEQIDSLNGQVRELRRKLRLTLPGAGEAEQEGPDPDGMAEYRTLLRKNRSLLEAIRDNDEACQRMLEERFAHVGRRLAEVRANKDAYKAYTFGPGPTGAWFFDKKK